MMIKQFKARKEWAMHHNTGLIKKKKPCDHKASFFD